MNYETRCPYCVRSLPECRAAAVCDLPAGYEQRTQSVPPVWVMSAGFSGHGKSTFWSDMAILLENLGEAVPGFLSNYMAHQPTQDFIKAARYRVRNHQQESATLNTRPEPLFFELNHLPIKAGSPAVTGRTLVIFDAAGELFTSAGGESEKLNFLPSVSTVWLLVSLKDLASGSEPVTISELFYSLQTTLQKLGTESGPSRFVVVFTKADLLSDSLPESVIKYLLDDPLQGLIRNSATVIRGFSVENYLKEAAKISADLEAFAVEQPGGRQFVNLLRRKGVDVSFCAVLTSGAPENEHGACRVLDPLFWTLLHAPKTEPELNRRFTLIVDNHEAGASSSLQSVMQTFRNVLSRRGRTSVYTLGNAVAGPVPGQSPHSGAAASCRPALIGPILERVSKEELVLVLTARQILDLPDFRNTEWRERMLVCSPVEFQDDPWPQTMLISSQQDCEIAVSRLIRPAVEAN